MSFLTSANFRQRILSALVMVPLALLVVHVGGWVFTLAVTALTAVGLYEWLRLVDPGASRVVTSFAYAALLVTLLADLGQSPAFGVMFGAVLTLILFFLSARDHVDRAGWVALGLPYMGGSGLALLTLHDMQGGRDLVYYLLLVVWGTDTGAYIAGRLIGGPKLIPAISPNKTWAGLFGGMALAAVFGYAAAVVLGAQRPEIGIGLAIIMAVVAQGGDFFKSYFKRRAGVKDSGSLIPGHGGVLDRIDGLVFAAVFFVMFQIALGEQMQWW
ncbi:MAG: phosphatidate cytidylyltransferase [Alphaproteobacteria bacterium]|nr:phosphatidate cytidylyltransferase [Alphaproteobacteria bacterium]